MLEIKGDFREQQTPQNTLNQQTYKQYITRNRESTVQCS